MPEREKGRVREEEAKEEIRVVPHGMPGPAGPGSLKKAKLKTKTAR